MKEQKVLTLKSKNRKTITPKPAENVSKEQLKAITKAKQLNDNSTYGAIHSTARRTGKTIEQEKIVNDLKAKDANIVVNIHRTNNHIYKMQKNCRHIFTPVRFTNTVLNEIRIEKELSAVAKMFNYPIVILADTISQGKHVAGRNNFF